MESSELERYLQQLPAHGGDVALAAKQFAIAAENWIDLSTGMNPCPYPIPEMPAAVFEQLPYWQAEFLAAAKSYYGTEHFLAVAGSQAAIECLPVLINGIDVDGGANGSSKDSSNGKYKPERKPVLMPEFAYQEHSKQWAKTNPISHYPSFNSDESLKAILQTLVENPCQHVLVVNPNNPTACFFSREKLLAIANRLGKGCFLIVDEAFVDLSPKQSLLVGELPENCIVLRSFGKFFGLAGIRLGFLFASKNLLEKAQALIGLWQVSGPAQFIASKAFLDVDWQNTARQKILEQKTFMLAAFKPLLGEPVNNEPNQEQLFLSYRLPLEKAVKTHQTLCQQAILTRLVVLNSREALLRVGLIDNSKALICNELSQRLKRVIDIAKR
jgi:cobalamin biosynthetic protein CobC